MIGAAIVTGALWYTNKQGYVRPVLYGVLGAALWYFVLKSGVHATIAGVVLAMTIPATGKLDGETVYPMHKWADKLKNWVKFLDYSFI